MQRRFTDRSADGRAAARRRRRVADPPATLRARVQDEAPVTGDARGSEPQRHRG